MLAKGRQRDLVAGMTFSWFWLVKLLVSAVVIVLVTEIQKWNDKLSALLIALPLTSLIAIVWMRVEGQESGRIANHAEATFWFVLPTLPMFLVFPWMLRRGWNVPLALLLNCLMTAALFWVLVMVMRRFGMRLL